MRQLFKPACRGVQGAGGAAARPKILSSKLANRARQSGRDAECFGENNMRGLRKFVGAVWVIGSVLLFSGCTTDGAGYLSETKSVDVTGAFQLVDRDKLETIDLGVLLCQYASQQISEVDACMQQAKQTVVTPQIPLSGGSGDTSVTSTATSEQINVDRSLSYFNNRIRQLRDSDRKAVRNALQERLLSASAQRCNAYKGNLQRTFSRTNFGLGVLTTVAGAAGALVNAPGAASNWAGLAAVSSGSRAEFNQDYMSNLAAYVIVDGIDKRRENVYELIQQKGQAKPYSEYPVEAAIKDALYYHGQCSVIAGFQQASDSIKTTNDPGLNAAISAMAKVTAANTMMRGDKSPAAILATARTITGGATAGGHSAGSDLPVDDGAGTGASFDRFLEVVGDIQTSNKRMELAVSGYASKAKSDAARKELGLDKPISFTDNLDSTTRDRCVAKLAEYAKLELQKRAAAEAETNESAKLVALADAALQRTKEAEIVAFGEALAKDYSSQAAIAIAEWERRFGLALDGDTQRVAAFKEKLANRPALNKAQKDKLKAVCPK